MAEHVRCTLNGIFVALPSLSSILRKPTALMGAPRSLKNRYLEPRNVQIREAQAAVV